MRTTQIAALATLLALGANLLQAQTPPQVRTMQGFSIVLLLGEPQGSIPSDGLSTQAKKALADIRDFLPYKGYRILDTEWVAGSDFGKSQGQIHGLDAEAYDFTITTTPRIVGSAPGTPDATLDRARFLLQRYGPVLDNSFNIKVGETVVVGTSRLPKSDNALIVLLTAVPVGTAAIPTMAREVAAYRPGNGVSSPKLIKEVKPNYTPEARAAKIQGTVLLTAVIREDGTVGDVKVARSLDAKFGLDNEAVKAAKQWTFSPGLKDGKPVPVVVTIELAFTGK